MASFILGSFPFQQPCSSSCLKIPAVTVEHYFTLLRDHVVFVLHERKALSVVIFIEDGVPPPIAHEIKTFLFEPFTENRVIVEYVSVLTLRGPQDHHI